MERVEYKHKKRECWENFKFALRAPNTYRKIFDFIFDRAYALGKQTVTITQEDVNKAAREYLLTRQQARHNAKKEEDATLRDFDKTIKAWDAFDMEQAYEDGANFALGKQEKDAEGEEMLTLPRKAIIQAYKKSCAKRATKYDVGYADCLYNLFGSKCLPDETKNGAKDSAKEPKPAEPKEDKHFDNILKEGFRGHNRLHIAAQIVAAIYANYQAAKGFKSIEELVRKALDITDTLIKESEKGG